MYLIQIKHYVANSFEGKPSFILTMSDGKDYISNGCQFKEFTKYNVIDLIAKYNCKEDIDYLMSSESIDIANVTNASYMFSGCTSLTSFTSDMANVTNASCMFNGCTSLIKFN